MKKKIILSWMGYKSSFKVIVGMLLLQLVSTMFLLYKNDFTFDENTIGLSICCVIMLAFCIFFYLYIYVGKIIFDEHQIERVSFLNKSTFYHYDDILIQSNGMALNIISREGITLFRISKLMDNAVFVQDHYEKYLKAHPEHFQYTSNKVSPNFYIKNFGIFFIIYGVAIGLLSLFYGLTEKYDTAFFILMIVGALFAFLGVILVRHYLTYKIIFVNDQLVFSKKAYPISTLSIKSATNSFKIYSNGKKILWLNQNFYDNWMIFYSEIKQYKQ